MQVSFYHALNLWSLVVLAAGQNSGLPIAGPNKPGDGDSDEALSIYEAAGRHPNATTNTTFQTNVDGDSPGDWTWLVNITDVPIPNSIYDLGQQGAPTDKGYHVVNSQWQLSWPSGEDSLQDYLSQRNINLRIRTLISSKPRNVTDAYTGADPNCAFLGQSCYGSLIKAAAARDPLDFYSVSRCESTLAVKGQGPDSQAEISFGPDNKQPEGVSIYRNSTIFYRTSTVFTNGNLTEYHNSERALQVLTASFTDRMGNPIGASKVLCQIVDKSAPAQSSAVHLQSSSLVLCVLTLLCMFIYSF